MPCACNRTDCDNPASAFQAFCRLSRQKLPPGRSDPTVQVSPTILLGSPGANVTAYRDKGVTYGLEYCYWVRAVRATGNKVITSGPSNTACAATPVITSPPPLLAPTSARIGVYSAHEFTVVWDYTAASETGFEIHRSTTVQQEFSRCAARPHPAPRRRGFGPDAFRGILLPDSRGTGCTWSPLFLPFLQCHLRAGRSCTGGGSDSTTILE